MDLLDSLQALAARVREQSPRIQSEEATKTALVLPFLRALGYDVFNPDQVAPGPEGNVGLPHRERVDFVLRMGGRPALLVECRSLGEGLQDVLDTQLYWCFPTAEARLAVLTNGTRYHFFADLDQPGILDEQPFFEFDLLAFRERDLEELKRFGRGALDVESILGSAAEQKAFRRLLRTLSDQMNRPAPEFLKALGVLAQVGPLEDGAQMEGFERMVRRAFQQVLADRLNDRWTAAQALDEGREDWAQEAPFIRTQLLEPLPEGEDPCEPPPTVEEARGPVSGPEVLEPEAAAEVPESDALLESVDGPEELDLPLAPPTSGLPFPSAWGPVPAPETGLAAGPALLPLGGPMPPSEEPAVDVPISIQQEEVLETAGSSRVWIYGAALGLLVVGGIAWKRSRPLPAMVAPPSAAPAPKDPSPIEAKETSLPEANGLRAALERGDLAGAAKLGEARVAVSGSAQWTLRLAIAHEPRTVQNLMASLKGRGDELFLRPIQMLDGRECYQVFLGSFADEAGARSAAAGLPGEVTEGGNAPKLYQVQAIPSRQEK